MASAALKSAPVDTADFSFWDDWPETVGTTIAGTRYVVLPEAVFREVIADAIPQLPPADRKGNRPAVEFCRVINAWDLFRTRLVGGLTRAELAKRAKISAAKLARIERGEIDPTIAETDRLDAALTAAGA